jgi:hypothetical protein
MNNHMDQTFILDIMITKRITEFKQFPIKDNRKEIKYIGITNNNKFMHLDVDNNYYSPIILTPEMHPIKNELLIYSTEPPKNTPIDFKVYVKGLSIEQLVGIYNEIVKSDPVYIIEKVINMKKAFKERLDTIIIKLENINNIKEIVENIFDLHKNDINDLLHEFKRNGKSRFSKKLYDACSIVETAQRYMTGP